MNGSCEAPEPTLCGCCAGIGTETPQPITNRPGLSAISYRVGTHNTFLASLLAALSGSSVPALAGLTTCDPSDFSLALLDAWATSLDILAFYQERIANESYLRTAVDSASVFALAQLVGYKPSPGVAASTFLAFTLTSAPGSPDNVLISAGTRVQSVPNPGQQPQVFETSSDITALIAQNAIPAQTTIPWQLFGLDQSTWIEGTANNINIGDALLFVTASSGQPVGTGPGDVHYVTAVNIDPNSGNTQIFWDTPLSSSFTNGLTAEGVSIFIFRKKAALYGVQAPNPLLLGPTTSNPHLGSIPGFPTSFGSGADWSFLYRENSNQINLDASYPGLAPQANGGPQWIVLTGLGYTSFFQITQAADSNPGYYTLTTKTTQLTLALGQILTGDTSLSLNEVLWEFVQETRNITAYVQSVPLTPADLPITTWTATATTTTYPLAPGMIVPVQGSTLSIVGGLDIAVGQPLGISGLRVRLQVLPSAGATFTPDGASAGLPVSDNQVFLVNAYPPGTDPVSGNPLWAVLTTSNVSGSLIVANAYVQFLPANLNDPATGEAVVVSTVQVQGNIVTLGFVSPLTGIYDATTVAVNANTVAATQGETMNEIMGSGDATNDALEFTLKQSPLTYVPSPLNNGAVSTLQVWVNNMQWHEVPNFLNSLPTDRVFITQTDSKQNVTVQFGDGIAGERTPTGQMNIRAVYRKGIGSAGNVASGQLSQALDRPQGLKGVTNPDPGTGGADPDTAADARTSAPLNVLTLGRVVSLEDYQNYALAFAGISQALATWTWTGRTRGVFLTVAGANGDVFQADDNTLSQLKTSLWNVGNPYVPIQIASYVPVLFEVGANVLIDQTDYDPTQVLAQVWQSLLTSFSFAQRQLGQGVAQSEIIAVIQQTPGVIAVQLTVFNPQGQPTPSGTPLQPVLLASAPAAGQQGTPTGAQMLLIDPACQGSIVSGSA
jgi:hypothetical protein